MVLMRRCKDTKGKAFIKAAILLEHKLCWRLKFQRQNKTGDTDNIFSEIKASRQM